MHLLLVRHAPAEDREDYEKRGEADELRPLTAAGRRKMERSAAGLGEVVPALDVLATSRLVRAVQTARILQKAYPKLALTQIDELAPSGTPEALARWLRGHPAASVVALVGHEPSLGVHAGWLLTGEKRALFSLKKGGACLLECDGPPQPGRAVLRWLLQPGHLRALAA